MPPVGGNSASTPPRCQHSAPIPINTKQRSLGDAAHDGSCFVCQEVPHGIIRLALFLLLLLERCVGLVCQARNPLVKADTERARMRWGSGSTALEESLPSVRPTAAAIFAPTPSAMLAARPIRPVLAETVCMSWKVTMLCAGMRAYTSSIAARSTPSTSNTNLNAWCGTCHNVMSRHCTTMMDTGGSTHHSLQRESTTIRWDHWRWIPVVEVRP